MEEDNDLWRGNKLSDELAEDDRSGFSCFVEVYAYTRGFEVSLS
jgi:hypothetical protein